MSYKRTPIPQKPPKRETPKNIYNRNREEEVLEAALDDMKDDTDTIELWDEKKLRQALKKYLKIQYVAESLILGIFV